MYKLSVIKRVSQTKWYPYNPLSKPLNFTLDIIRFTLAVVKCNGAQFVSVKHSSVLSTTVEYISFVVLQRQK